MKKIEGVALEQEIGYRGWLHFKVFKVSQSEMDSHKIRINIWIVDANQRKHKLHFKKKDEKNWNTDFYIGLKTYRDRNKKN